MLFDCSLQPENPYGLGPRDIRDTTRPSVHEMPRESMRQNHPPTALTAHQAGGHAVRGGSHGGSDMGRPLSDLRRMQSRKCCEALVKEARRLQSSTREDAEQKAVEFV